MRALYVSIYYAAGFLQGLALVTIPAASTIFKAAQENAISDFQYGFLTLPMILAAIAVTSFLKQILAWLGRSRAYYLGIVLNIAYMLLAGSVYFTKGDPTSSFILLMSANFMLGAGFGLLVSMLNILTVEVQPQKSDALLTGLHACFGIGAAFSPQLVSLCHNFGYWQAATLITTASLAAIFIASFLALPTARLAPSPSASQAAPSAKQAAPSASRLPLEGWFFMLLIVFYAIIETIINYWSSDYLSIEKGLGLKQSLEALSIFWALVTVGRVLASLITLKLDGWYLYLLSPIAILGAISLLIPSDSSVVLFVYILLGLGCSYFFPLSISLATRSYFQLQERISGLCIAALMTGIGLGNFVIGTLKNQGYIELSEAFESAGIIALVLLIGTLWLFFRVRKAQDRT